MKTLRQLCLGLLLTLALSISAFAGDISSPGFDGPQESPGITGDISTPGVAGPQESPGITGDPTAPGETQGPGLALFLLLFF